jgi:hypothetical protein
MDVQAAEAATHFELSEGAAVLPLLEVHPEFAEGPVTVMKVMPGTLADQETIFASHAVHYIRRTLTGLEYCHGHRDGVLHGDVKPSNIFLGPSGEVLLGDFGVADELTGGARGYTLEYAAPELLQGAERSIETDLWATAVTFYELLTGQLPFGAEPETSPEDITDRITRGAYSHPDDILPYLPLRFRQFFRGAFNVDPARRPYSTAASMRNELKHLAARVEWVRMRRAGCVVCFEGHEVTGEGVRTGVVYEAAVIERPQLGRFEPHIKRASGGGGALRRLRGLENYSGSKRQAGQKLSVWMRTLMERGDISR